MRTTLTFNVINMLKIRPPTASETILRQAHPCPAYEDLLFFRDEDEIKRSKFTLTFARKSEAYAQKLLR